MRCTVSVVLATYNGERFLREQLVSLEAQSLPPAQVIISDDGSSDSSLAIADEFARRAPFPVTVVRNPERLGYGANFLAAAALATADLVAFCDQDDVWYPHKLRRCAEILASTGAVLVVHRADLIGADSVVCGTFDQQIDRDEVLEPLTLGPWAVFYGCTMVFRRDLLELVDLSARGAHTFEHDTLLSHDLWVTFLATSMGRVALVAERLIGYRQHEGNTSPSVASMSFRRWTSSLGLAADARLGRDRTAAHRADLLQTLAADAGRAPEIRQNARTGAQYWRRVARLERRRLDVYGSRSFPARAVVLARLVLVGAYRSGSVGGLGPRLLAKDVVAGALQIRRSEGRRLASSSDPRL